jgi:hypothetical protein
VCTLRAQIRPATTTAKNARIKKITKIARISGCMVAGKSLCPPKQTPNHLLSEPFQHFVVPNPDSHPKGLSEKMVWHPFV